MTETNFDETTAATQFVQPIELNERELSQVAAGGSSPTEPPASSKCPIVIVD